METLTSHDFNKIKNCNFDFSEDFYLTFHNFIKKNPFNTIPSLVKKIKFYNFTEETLLLAFKLFNTCKCTYNNICGPFLNINEYWIVLEKKTQIQQENIKLKQTITSLEKEIRYLKKNLLN